MEESGQRQVLRASEARRLSFGPFCFDRSLATLHRGDEEIPLPPRAAALLEQLLARPGELHRKEQLLETVWEGRIVGEESLTQAISVLRHALEDDPRDPIYIRTVARRGYVFLAQVEGEPTPEAIGGGTAPTPPSRRTRLRVAVAAVVALGFATALVLLSGPGPSGPRGEAAPPAITRGDSSDGNYLPRRPSIAVLAFENLGPAQDGYFAAGITEELTARLASASGLAVISLHGPQAGDDPSELGAEFDADYVLEGAVRWAAGDGPGRVRVTPRLIRVADRVHLWAGSYDRELRDIFAVQSEIANEVLAELGVRLAEGERAWVEDRPTHDPDAYHAFLRGREIQNRLGNFGTAAALFERATELDPGFADAYACLAIVKADRYGRGVERTPEDLARIRQAVDRAVALAPDRPAVLQARADYRIACESDPDGALELFQRLADRYPGLPAGPLGIGSILLLRGDWQGGVAAYERARALAPEDRGVNGTLADIYRGVRRFEASEELWNLAIAAQPQAGLIWARKAEMSLAWHGDLDEVRHLLEGSPPDFEVSQQLFVLEMAVGDRDAAIGILSQELVDPSALDGPWQEADARLGIALALRVAGRPDEARHELETLRSRLEELLAAQPSAVVYSALLARTLALLDERETALELAEQTARSTSDNRWRGAKFRETVAFVNAWTGDPEAALDEIDSLLSIPYWRSLTPARLALEPDWTPLHSQARFRSLAEPMESAEADPRP